MIYNDFTNSDQTVAAFQARLANRDGMLFTEDLSGKILSFSGSSSNFLHVILRGMYTGRKRGGKY